ncbi:outer membrane protein [Xanthobacteraceae bacterium A53D]
MLGRRHLALSVSAAALLVAQAGMVRAADLVAKAPTAAAATSWTGFYLGLHAGAGQTTNAWGIATGDLAPSVPLAYPVDTISGSGLAGGQIGYNYQLGNIVLGVELDASAGQLSSRARCGDGWTSVCNAETNALGTLTARVGYAFDNMLVYGKAGGAFASSSFALPGTLYAGRYVGSDTATGWTLGGGVEVALTPQVSAKAEYAYMDFGSGTVDLHSGAAMSQIELSRSAQVVKVGLNWRPGAAPLPGTTPGSDAAGHDWTGLYLGGHLGGAWGQSGWSNATGLLDRSSSPGGFPGTGNAMGLLAGGQIGYNQQFGRWVAGLEASVSAADADGYAKCASNAATNRTFSCRDTVTSLGTFAGRLGWTAGDALFYGKAGAAWARANGTAQPTSMVEHLNQSGTRWGWMVGAGVEYAIDRNLSAFLEYSHLDFGAQDLAYAGFGETATASFKQRLDIVRMGLNYRLAWDKAGTKSAPKAFAMPVGWTAQVGARYFMSEGRMQKDLFDPNVRQRLNSRLIYENTTGQSLETFFRFDNRNGVFLKGFAGLGSLAGGSLYDEDFPAGPVYSNTLSSLRNGHLSYGALDLGYDFIRQNNSTLGAFVGYRALYQQVNGYGCVQIAASDVCDAASVASTPAILGNLGLSETELWQGVALGLNTRLALSDRLRLEIDAAYLPYVQRTSYDNHWFRSDINPQVERGQGWGTQLEAMLTYAVTDRLDVGVGGRYWFFATDSASTQFPMPLPRSPETFYAERYGAFLQASYRFGDLPRTEAETEWAKVAKAPEAARPVNWTGLYAGATLGVGKGSTAYASPFARPVTGDEVDLGGALAGGQIGADYQWGQIVVGAEASGAWAHLTGTNTCFSTAPAGALSGFNCGSRITGLGTVTGRLGYAFDRALIYARGGFAFDQQTDSFNNVNFTSVVLKNQSSNTGWTLGGGIEYALLSNLSVGLEYKHFDFGGSSEFFTSAPPSLVGVNLAPESTRVDTVSMTLNYRFNPFE